MDNSDSFFLFHTTGVDEVTRLVEWIRSNKTQGVILEKRRIIWDNNNKMWTAAEILIGFTSKQDTIQFKLTSPNYIEILTNESKHYFIDKKHQMDFEDLFLKIDHIERNYKK